MRHQKILHDVWGLPNGKASQSLASETTSFLADSTVSVEFDSNGLHQPISAIKGIWLPMGSHMPLYIDGTCGPHEYDEHGIGHSWALCLRNCATAWDARVYHLGLGLEVHVEILAWTTSTPGCEVTHIDVIPSTNRWVVWVDHPIGIPNSTVHRVSQSIRLDRQDPDSWVHTELSHKCNHRICPIRT